MSIEALRWALEVGQELGLEPTQRHILLILGNRADEAGGSLYPSVDWICQRTGLARRTVQAHLKDMEAASILTRSPRTNSNGDRTSDAFQLAMKQPGLPLGEGGAEFAPPRAGNDMRGAHLPHPGGARTAPKKQDYKQEEKKEGGQGKPSPVAAGFKTYAEGIKRRYGTDYPPSAKANGVINQIARRVGAENLEAVIGFYLGSPNTYYARRQHALEPLLKDCEQLYMDLQRAAGGAGTATIARVALVKGDEQVARDLGTVPIGAPEAIAKTAFQSYRGLIAKLQANKVDVRYIDVSIGKHRHRYGVSELST